ncbi:TIP41-like protein [Saccoglossus kowalevskii]|uniref:TIP41-like protein n=1 Tax=Saccoglossus kowalevskii TaxID=10224 RepID=A0ABM0GZF5_SACKO|nr:PREDICTED: TIP41-like protein-like [Saccoglossus kowalevskii]
MASKSNKGAHQENFSFGPWTIILNKSHILKSNCLSIDSCKQADNRTTDLCVVCKFQKELALPQLPEMVFAENLLRILHSDGFGIEFNTLDALKLVDDKHDLMKVAVAERWREARQDSEFINEVIKPFDWTYTTNYKGTLLGEDEKQLKTIPTDERIDMEKLKIREKIFYFEEVILFEDELADNGVAFLNIKIRVMQSSFFLLMRFFLRVDDVIIRINDNRLYHENDWNYMLREYTSKEKRISDLISEGVSSNLFTNPVNIAEHLTVVEESFEKLEFLESVATEK